MKTTNLLLLVCASLTLLTGPLKTKNGQPTDYYYYSNKYGDLWDPHDTCINYQDTLYIYKFGGQNYIFNQHGKKVINYHLKNY